MVVKSKLPDAGTSIFAIMSGMAAEEGAINLSQGFPGFPLDTKLIALVNRYMQEGHNQYAPMPGVPALRKMIAEVILKTYRQDVDPDSEITITAGGTQAIYTTLTALINKGDEVIVFDPSYDCYNPAIRLNGGVPVHINLRLPHFAIDWNEVRAKITPRTKMIMINTPHNPCGSVLSEEDLITLEEIVEQHDLIVLSDEVYERIIFDGYRHHSVLSRPRLFARSIAVFSFGKTFHATGWKTGYTVAPSYFTNEIRKVHQFMVFSVNTPVQHALAAYMEDAEHYQTLSAFYEKKRNYFLELLKGSSFEPLACHGSYFQLLNYEAISKSPDRKMAEELTRKHKVASIPVSVFYQDNTDHRHLRFCFAKDDATLEKAAAILRKL